MKIEIGKEKLQLMNSEHQYTHHPRGSFFLKRIVDIFGSISLLILLSPIFIITTILIKLSSPGPVFHIRERIGHNLCRFKMWKFRTMIQNAEDLESIFMEQNKEDGPFFKVRSDPRLTKFGGFFRRYSIDELPQLVNVLKGDMSLVGPRPLFDHEVDRFSGSKQYLRFAMKPGLTCIWQVNGRSNTPFESRMKQDLEYIENWSLSLDAKLLLKTIPAVIRGEGAV